jgi:hypothetical protein
MQMLRVHLFMIMYNEIRKEEVQDTYCRKELDVKLFIVSLRRIFRQPISGLLWYVPSYGRVISIKCLRSLRKSPAVTFTHVPPLRAFHHSIKKLKFHTKD